jgi:hypothetical protein
MTIKELLTASADGMPMVTDESGRIGQVVVIKKNRDYAGCAVEFPGVLYDIWFNEDYQDDRRRRYMKELKLISK